MKLAPSRSGGAPPPPVLSGPAALPRPALALAHGGGLAWDCKWRPTGRGVVSGGVVPASPAASPACPLPPPFLGVLAAALGDGSVVVWAVPVPPAPTKTTTPSTAGKKRKGPAGEGGAPPPSPRQPPILDLPPAAAGRCGLPSCLEWCPAPPLDLLAAACWDGSAVLWRIGEWGASGGGGGAPPAEAPPRPWSRGGGGGGGGCQPTPPFSYGLSPLLRVQAGASPLRAIAWPPPPLRTAYPGSPPLTPFATAGHAADLCVWEAGGSPAAPRLSIALPREWALSLAWLPHPLGMLVAQDGGRLTFAPLDAGSSPSPQAFAFDGHGEAWSVHATRAASSAFVAAYGVGSGDVGVFEVRGTAKARASTVHRVVAGFRRRTASGGGAAAGAAPSGGRGGAGGGRGRGRGRGRGTAAAPPPPPTAPGLVLPSTDRTLVLPPAAVLAKDACIYSGAPSSPAAAKAAAARSARPDEGVAVTRVRWAEGGGSSGSDWTWLASAGGGGVVRLQLVDVRGCGEFQECD